ncbi:TAXI family TRAP transporter solute-binding subunit [Inquilinus sp. CAU 1745]|uniref:TAXI family TRAP transporter solute-binding subunit n=1 Tax=Inquilinus sp. CAU 1745 TaxID=3140369 RepID=UPI00325BB7CD
MWRHLLSAEWNEARRSGGRTFAAATLAVTVAALPVRAADPVFFRIGTGGVGGTYYPIATLIAEGIAEETLASERPIIAAAQVSNGSTANIEGLASGLIEGGFAQANVVAWAYEGTEIFEGQPPRTDLRAIANLYPETLHLVTDISSGIETIEDLEGRRVSLDEQGSGTLIDARMVLAAHDLSEADIVPEYMKPDLGLARIEEGRLDAFFIVAGTPVGTLEPFAEAGRLSLVSVAGEEIDQLLDEYSFYSPVIIPEGTYEGVGAVETIGVGAQFVTTADADEETIYRLTRALWSDTVREKLDAGHPRGRQVLLTNALNGIAIPLHPGSERFYREVGLLP